MTTHPHYPTQNLILQYKFFVFLFIIFQYPMTDVDGQPLLNLEHVGIDISRRIANLKINYLMEQKQTLQIQVNELEMSNKMLKKINQEIFNGEFTDVKCVLDRNYQLQEKIENILKQNRQLRADLFVYSQVNQQNLKQQKQILESYEQKIFQMRFLIHSKQAHIQKIQQKQQDNIYTPKSERLQFLQQFILLKKVNSHLSINNMELKIENNQLKNELIKIGQQIKKSKNNQAEQISQYYDNNIQQQGKTYRTKMSIQSTVSSSNRNNTSSVIEGLKLDWNRLTQCESNISILMQMIKQQKRQITNFKLKLKVMEESNDEKNVRITKLIQSYNISERKRKNLYEQLRQLKINLQTGSKNQSIQSSLAINKHTRDRNGKFHIEQLQKRKEYWLDIQKQLQQKIHMINPDIKRSRSNSLCISPNKIQSLQQNPNQNKMKLENLQVEQLNFEQELSRIEGVQGFNKKLYKGNTNIDMIENIFDY